LSTGGDFGYKTVKSNCSGKSAAEKSGCSGQSAAVFRGE